MRLSLRGLAAWAVSFAMVSCTTDDPALGSSVGAVGCRSRDRRRALRGHAAHAGRVRGRPRAGIVRAGHHLPHQELAARRARRDAARGLQRRLERGPRVVGGSGRAGEPVLSTSSRPKRRRATSSSAASRAASRTATCGCACCAARMLDRTGVELSSADGYAGTFNAQPLDAAALRTLSEYLWHFTAYNNAGHAVVASESRGAGLTHALTIASLERAGRGFLRPRDAARLDARRRAGDGRSDARRRRRARVRRAGRSRHARRLLRVGVAPTARGRVARPEFPTGRSRRGSRSGRRLSRPRTR